MINIGSAASQFHDLITRTGLRHVKQSSNCHCMLPDKQKQEGESRNKPNKTEFTVDIFTSKTSQEREVEEKKTGGEVSEDSGEEVELTSLSSPVSSSRPTVKCLTCGKEFGKSSIKFHEPQCRKKKIAEDLRKEKEKSVVEEKPVSYIDHIPGKCLKMK